MKLFASLLVYLNLVVVVTAQIPIPKREVGFVYGSGRPDAPVHFDVYIDLTCPDSKAVWPTVLQVADHYGADTLKLTTHLFPLPYHRVAFYAAKGVHVIEEMTGGVKTYEWISVIFDSLEFFTNSATFRMSDEEVVARLGRLAEGLLSWGSQQFKRKLVHSRELEMDTRVAWKYGCTRGVAATPTFMVNDITVDAPYDWTLEDWRQVIDPLLQP